MSDPKAWAHAHLCDPANFKPFPKDWPTVDDVRRVNQTMPEGMAMITLAALSEALRQAACMDDTEATESARDIIQALKEPYRRDHEWCVPHDHVDPENLRADCICPRPRDGRYDPDCRAHASDRHVWGVAAKEAERDAK